MMRVALVYAGQMADTVAVLMMSSCAGNEGVADQLCTLRAKKKQGKLQEENSINATVNSYRCEEVHHRQGEGKQLLACYKRLVPIEGSASVA